MIPANAIHRVFRIRFGDWSGTAFTNDVENREYLVTARHVVDGMSDSDELMVFPNGDWNYVDRPNMPHSIHDMSTASERGHAASWRKS